MQNCIREKILEVGIKNCVISQATVAELQVGYYYSRNENEKKDISFVFVAKTFSIIPTDSSVWNEYSRIRTDLMKQGKKIPFVDALIMATASVRKYVVVSHDRHFLLNENTAVEDWITEGRI